MGKNYNFTVDSVIRSTSEGKLLLRYLREGLHLHLAKDRCNKGVRDTYIIVVDGKTVKPRILATKRAVSKNIIITEGLSDAEKEAFAYAFGAMGSVQCRFCTPGMIIVGKALADRIPDPTEEEVKSTLKENICRCTGYKRVMEGIQLTAAILRGDAKIEESLEKGDSYGTGKRVFRLDMREKVLRYDECPGDMEMEGMVYASVVHSKYPRAKVLNINFQKAMVLPGVLAVLTAEDAPNNKVGHLQQGWDTVVTKSDITRCMGDTICLVVVETGDILEDAKKLVKIDYGKLTPVCLIHGAMTEDAPRVHEKGSLCRSRHVTHRDAGKALENSEYTVTQIYTTPFAGRGFLRPECVMTFPYKDDARVYSPGQGVYDIRKEISIVLGRGPDHIVVGNKLIGGDFGRREDIFTQHIAALTALEVQRPAKVVFSRQESISFHLKHRAMKGTSALECDENGIFTGFGCEIYFDTGAYASLCGSVLRRTCTRPVGPHYYQDMDIRGFNYYTNNPPAGAFWGFGVCQSEFILGSNISLLTEKVGISPWKTRYRNAVELGKALSNSRIVDCSTALKGALLAVKGVYEGNQGRTRIACVMRNADVSAGLPDRGHARLKIHNGKVELHAAASDIDQGCATVLVQIVAGVTGLKKGWIENVDTNSGVTPGLGIISGSRQALITSEAVGITAADILEAPKEAGNDMSQLEGKESFAEFFDPIGKLGADVPDPKSHVACGFAAHVVILDDEGKTKEVYAAHDSDKMVSPISIQGRIEDGVLMELDHALTGGFPLKNDVPQAKYGTLGPIRSTRIPDVHVVYVEKEEQLPFAYGAKGVGEIVTIPTTPTAQDAYCAMDHILRAKLPMENTFYKKRK